MENDYYCSDDSHHYDTPAIDRFSHFYLVTKQNNAESHYAKLYVNTPKKSPKCEPLECIKRKRKTCIFLAAIVILASIVVAITSKYNLNLTLYKQIY